MKNNQASRLTAKRTSTSPYFSPTFNQLEQESLNQYIDMLPSDSGVLSDILITNTHTNFDLLSGEQVDNLKLIIHPNSGYDNFPVDFVKGSKAPIVIGSTIRAQAVAQYILSSLFSHFASIPTHTKWDVERKWPRKLISDLKITIIGFGHIGKILHTTLAPMVKELNVYDPFENLTQLNNKNSDVVILACGLNSKSRHIIDKNFLNAMKDTALIINAARGELIKTHDLVNFLKANDEAYAVLDVFEKEPNNFTDFVDLTNIKLTSHIAGVYKNIDLHTIDFETEVVSDFLELTSFDFNNKYQKMILQNKLRPEIGII
ncbi:NAD(P)-dependent oxidoreductase [Bacteriovorax sp. PP10]|uniref:NAD(P)-dependent oxidoreductase n=1 Tax=Bacteriovorax antarcticus TaxID=3088717 RepID=A0ABU5VTC2_9BACT|nr:NAD(P)-dependent oxidoreductase [Bacteriovorax sp. PP10]MEA9356302.1 NAD(P)-dependent oxidoreductase [Bacteriovorax sp. PP10]